MATRGRPPKEKEFLKNPPTKTFCLCCGEKLDFKKNFYATKSKAFGAIGKVPICKECLDKLCYDYATKYKSLGYTNPERKAMERICMLMDWYYADKVLDAAVNDQKSGRYIDTPLVGLYVKRINLSQNREKGYDGTINEKIVEGGKDSSPTMLVTESDIKANDKIAKAIEIFGEGFEKEDYLYLYSQYTDWTARHECNTKAQEELFKQICFTQLELQRANRAKGDTKDLTIQFQKLLDSAKLQPKQNSGEAMSDSQTLGTLIDKWENTRPIPEVDPELADVDKIGLYLDTFFRGHLAKMMGLKNGLSNLYDKFIAKYTVKKPEYEDDEDNEVLFDAIFGGSLSDEEEVG